MKIYFPSIYVIAIVLAMTISVPQALGQLTQQKDLYANNDDVYGTFIDSTNTYDPCCNGLTWLDEFRRTTVAPDNPYYIRFDYSGVSPTVNHVYRSDHYEPGDYSFNGSLEISSSTAHKLIITKTSVTEHGAFTLMHMKASYWDPQQSGPGSR